MTVILFEITANKVALLTDTLACDEHGDPVSFIDKVDLLPHLDLAVVGSGAGHFQAAWAHLLRTTRRGDVDQIDAEAPAELAALWESMELGHSGAAPDGDRTTIYHLGWSEAAGQFRGYAYRSDRGFESDALPAGAVGIRPQPQFRDYDVDSLEGWVELSIRLREQGIARRLRGERASTIGGQLVLTVLGHGSTSVTRLHRFDEDYEAMEGIHRRTLASSSFHTNENGEEVFAYPASGWISEKLFGVKVPLTGRVAGLSLMTEVVPGIGPVAQMTAGAILPDAPEWDRVQNILFPFGELDTSGGVIESLLPAWVNKFRHAGWTPPFGPDEGQWNSTVMDVARWLSSTGEYDTSTVDGMNELIDAARSKAQGVYVLRGAAQFFAPTAPTPEWVALDKDGDALVVQALISEYQELRQEDPNSATLRMLDRYGEQIFLMLQGKTAEVTPNAPVSDEGADWERANPGIVKRYENVFGFFAPQGGDLDSAAFARQLEKGRRVRITPHQAVRLANNRVARAIYSEAKRKVPSPNLMQAAALRNLKAALRQKYPGAFESVGIPEQASLDQLVADLSEAVHDERLRDNPLTGPLRTYLQAREKVAQAGTTPTSFRTSGAMAGPRAALRVLGEALSEKSPQFAEVYERVFDAELADEAEVVDGAVAR